MAIPNFIGEGLGADQLSVAAAGSTSQDGRGAVTLGDPTPTGGVSPYTYAWTWTSRPDGASATFSDSAIAQPTVTPDAEGTWVAVCTVTDGDSTTIEYPYSFVVGVDGIWEVVYEADLKAIGAASAQDLDLGDTDYTLDSQTVYCATSRADGTLTNFDIGANGIDVEPGVACTVNLAWDVTAFGSWETSDDIVVRCRAEIVAGGLSTNNDRIDLGFSTTTTVPPPANSFRAGLLVTGGNWWSGQKIGSGALTAIHQMAAAEPSDLRVELAGERWGWKVGADLSSGAWGSPRELGDPDDDYFIRLDSGSNNAAAAEQQLWGTAQTYLLIFFNFAGAGAHVRLTEIQILRRHR